MKTKTIAVRYQSRGGNTKAVAQVIAETIGVKAELIGAPLDEPVDLLFVGGGVYALGIDSDLKNWLDTLDPEKVKAVAAYTTAGGLDGTNKIALVAKARGIAVAGQLPIRLLARNYAGVKGRITLKDKEIAKIKSFAVEMSLHAVQ
ncbi:MAG: hypothetical protein LBB94_10835 [Clostridiales bacterium]|jgi:flavodoxin|nr:hypothetical protein [Clostridiales bacterium]